MNTAAGEELATQHIRKLIRRCLEQCSAMRRDQLVARIGMDGAIIAREIEDMVRLGEVEVIRPLATTRGECPDEPGCPRTHYRLLKDTDGEFAWEQFQLVHLPVGRLADVRASEDRPARLVPRMAEEVWG